MIQLRKFLRDIHGVTAIEVAMIMPVFAFIMLMITQIGLYFWYTAGLERGTEAAVRQIITGAVANENLTSTKFINTVVCPNLPAFNCSNVIINIQVAPPDFYSLTNKTINTAYKLGYAMSGLNVSTTMDNLKTSYCIGGNGSIIAVQIFYAMPIIGLPFMLSGSNTFNGQNVIWISSTAVFKNEPFSTNYTGC